MSALKVGSGGLPIGQYKTEFAGVEAAEANKDYGPGLKWKWKVTEGPCLGQTATRVTGPAPTPKNACGKMLSGLIGRSLAEGEEIDPAAHVGKKYLVIVGQGQNGTRVEAIIAI